MEVLQYMTTKFRKYLSMSIKERKYCFKRGGYDIATSRVIVQFSDESVYSYDGLTVDNWMEWKAAYPHGTYFDLEYRLTDIEYTKLNTYPGNLFFEFVDPS
jgi:hypothetical protein